MVGSRGDWEEWRADYGEVERRDGRKMWRKEGGAVWRGNGAEVERRGDDIWCEEEKKKSEDVITVMLESIAQIRKSEVHSRVILKLTCAS